MATASEITPALLNYISHSTYPDSETVASSTLDSSTLSSILISLRSAQDEARSSIRTLSRESAPDVDEWISRAKTLQQDIARSRQVAREIVAEAALGERLRAEVEDKRKKVELLEREVGFQDALAGTLHHVRYANGLLERVQEEAVRGDVSKALRKLDDAESSIEALQSPEESRCVEILRQRRRELKGNLVESATECWDALVHVDHDQRKLVVKEKGLRADVPDASVPTIELKEIVEALKKLEALDTLVQKLAKDIERTILRPRMNKDEKQLVTKIVIEQNELQSSGTSDDTSTSALFKDLHRIIEFLATRLPTSITTPLSISLIPTLTTRLEDQWLEPALPVTLADVASFTPVIADVESLADQLDGYSWHGVERLRTWIENAPRTWLTKRRETVLGDVRNFVFSGLSERKVVERVETRVMSKEDAAIAGGGGESDDWDTAWDDSEEGSGAKKQVSSDDEDEESSAWNMDDDDPIKKGEGEDDAWGWGDEDTSQKPPSPSVTRQVNGKPAPSEQEMTLRETFTVTAIPDGILEIIQQTISDAETLASDDSFADSPIRPAAGALYTLPTLALAIYRATAPTAYSTHKVQGLGNMLIYNDGLRLADQLRYWQNERSQDRKLRLDNDVTALETFAKRAYASEMEAQRTVLRDLLDGAQGFANCTAQPFKRECEGAVQATVDRVRDVHKLWKDVLSQGALLQSLGSLLSTITQKKITEIEELGDIGEAESQQLKNLCNTIASLKDIFTQTPEDGEEQDLTFIYCPTWLKFQYLAEILESSLADIKWMWKEGELALEFEGEEVVELVEALFAESELRRGAVREIRRGR